MRVVSATNRRPHLTNERQTMNQGDETMLFTTAFFDGMTRYATRRRDNTAHRETIKAISELPPHLLKDIGWPNAYDRQRTHRR